MIDRIGWGLAAAALLCGCATRSVEEPATGLGCPDVAAVETYAADLLAARPTAALGVGASKTDALCGQERLVAALTPRLGPVVGYKAGLTSAAAQERFGASEPVRGVLLRDMLLPNGATAPAAFAARPLFEADLLLVIGDDAINEARTVAEAIRHVAAVRPFIELPALAVAEGEPVTPATLTAQNVGARYGVMGAPIPVSSPETMLAALRDMTVEVTAANGRMLASTSGAAVLGHPVESALWLISEGVRLSPGDLVSVGSIGPLFPPSRARGAATVTYRGLPGTPSVRVYFQR